jgi:hypothetical protein
MATRGRTLAAVTALAVGAACGGSGGGQVETAAAAADPCLLVRPADAEDVLGSIVTDGDSGPGVPTMLLGEKACQYQPSEEGRAGFLRVGVVDAFPTEIFDKYATEHPTAVAVPGLALDARWQPETNALVVRDDDQLLTVVIVGSGVTDHKERAVALAGKLLDRLDAG